MDDLERQRERRRIADDASSTPNCPRCLHRMDAVHENGDDLWRCAGCA